MNTLELLAPARNLETGIDAVNCGADAVYIGAEFFGARNGAANTLGDIETLAAYAHRYNAKVYAAVNTILSNEELPRAKRQITRLWEVGADAVIIQDMGLLEAGLPPIPLIASTQCNNDTIEKILFLEKAGFKRVILPRELSLKEIKAIRAATTVELEAFVHGSLCVSYSGQCYLSHFMGGRSGNRGECAQPCRKVYKVTDAIGQPLEAGHHPLCLKDLNLSRRLGDLAAAGITSFKIEGRLKDRAYVRNTVTYYRQELDKVIASGYKRASAGTSFPGFVPNLAKTFNRGFTQFFLDGNPSDVASPATPKFTGEPLGLVFDIKEGSFKIHGADKLNPGDGISYFDKTGTLAGSLVNGVKDGRVRADNLKGMDNGTALYRNYDRLFVQSVEKAQVQRKFALKLEFTDYEGGYTLKGVDERGITAEVKLRGVKSEADKPEAALETIRKQLSKLGDSNYFLRGLDIRLSAQFFIPVSALNDLRRELTTALDSAASPAPREERPLKHTEHPYPEEKLGYTANVLNSMAAAFYKRHGVKEIALSAEGGANMAGQPLMIMRFCLRRKLGLCKKGREKVEPLYLQDEEGNKMRLEFDCEACRMRLYCETAVPKLAPAPKKPAPKKR